MSYYDITTNGANQLKSDWLDSDRVKSSEIISNQMNLNEKLVRSCELNQIDSMIN